MSVHPHDADPTLVRRSMRASGIGFAGIDGAWWLPATRPFELPAASQAALLRCGRAIFALLDAVQSLYATPARDSGGLEELLAARVSAAIPRLVSSAPVLGLRPDFQLQVQADGGYRFVATELEICPSAQGFAHAMQLGYGLATDLAASQAALLRGRELLIVASAAWSEFIFEQLAFCRALAAYGGRARLLLDQPLARIAQEIRAGLRWQPPLFGVVERPATWDDDLLARLERSGLAAFMVPDEQAWPEDVGRALVFRFGYFDCFHPAQLAQLQQWEQRGATFLNPTSFIFDSKVVLAALNLPAVRARIAAADAEALEILDACIPETRLLVPALRAQLLREQAGWVLKYAGFDQDNQAWGGRSLVLGFKLGPAEWQQELERCLELPWPVVAQRVAPTARIDSAYFDQQNQVQWLRGGSTRLRCFLLRDDQDLRRVGIGGAHLTVSGGERVSEGTDAVQAPVRFV